MRFELSGSLIRPDPLVLTYTADATFDTLSQIDLGYTHFEAICIGAGGGSGGGIHTTSGTLYMIYGGEGGGGGFHRARGLLSALPDSCAVVVGSAGSPGTDHASNPALTTDGEDGEASTFNTNTCRASGGEGGKRVQTFSETESTLADGGIGGAGNRVIAGGGAEGGTAGIPSSTGPGTPGTAGTDGTFANNVGKGGGGGAGGFGKEGAVACNEATAGGRGSYNPGDISVYGPAELPQVGEYTAALNTKPGRAGGAKAAPLNGLPTVYGRSGEDGVVIIRLTVE